jgi:dTDP-glucose 4,6-dehydratase
MYASDLMVWLWRILLIGEINQPYNVGSDESISIKELAEKICSISNDKVAVKILGLPVQQDNVDIYCPSILKANSINAQIKVQLTESIEKTIKFYEK